MSFRWIRRRLVLVVIGVAAAFVALAGVAWAYWSAQAPNVPAYSRADTMGVGARPTATLSGGAATLTWLASTTVNGHAVGGYLVNRYPTATGGTAIPAAQGTCAASPVTGTSCAEANLPAGTWYYTVTPVLGNWRGTESPRANAITTSDSYVLSLPGGTTTLTAGTATTLTVTATAGAQTDIGYTGPKTLTFGGPGISPGGNAPSYNNGTASVTFTNGVASLPMTLYKAESPTLTAISTDATGSLGLTVNPAATSAFGVSVPSTATAGVAQTVSVTAQDAYGNTTTAYSGGKTLTWSGPANAPNGQAPAYPTNPVSFVNGVASGLSATFYDAQTTTLTVSAAGPISGTSSSFTVVGGAATKFALSQPGTQAAGVAFNVTVTAQDTYGNAASYSGGSLSFSGPHNGPDGAAPTYPANPVTFTNGTATVSITLVKAESITLTVSASGVTGQTPITVNAGNPTNLAWTSASAGGGTLGACLFTCTTGSMNNKVFTASISVTDSHGNIVSNIGAAKTITVTASTTAGDLLGAFTSPTSTNPVTLTIPASGTATSNPLAFNAPTGNWNSDTLTATGGGYANATATINK